MKDSAELGYNVLKPPALGNETFATFEDVSEGRWLVGGGNGEGSSGIYQSLH